MKRCARRAAAAAALLCAVGAVQAASFACTGTLTAVERQVCADAEVSQLDEYLARYYDAARGTLRTAAACLAADQRAWLRTVRNACADAACLQRVYLARLAELDGLQPGASALKTLPLPPVPTLVAIVPPAADRVAAPPTPGAPLQEARGTLLNEVSTGDGYVLQAAGGRKHVVVSTMFIDDSSERLNALVGQPDVVYAVRGPREGSGPHFAQAGCRFVHRLPRP